MVVLNFEAIGCTPKAPLDSRPVAVSNDGHLIKKKIMKLLLQQIHETPNSTVSKLLVDGVFCCFILEDGHRNIKVAGETRIPEGVYAVKARTYGKFFNRYKKGYGHTFVPELVDVPGFSDILIHQGNTTADTRGCLLAGNAIGYDPTTNTFFITSGQSSVGYLRLYRLLLGAFAVMNAIEIVVQRASEFLRMVPYTCVECKQPKERSFGDMLHTLDATRCPECKVKIAKYGTPDV